MNKLKFFMIFPAILSVGLSLNFDAFNTAKKLLDIQELEIVRVLNAAALSQVSSEITGIYVSATGEFVGAQIFVPGAVLLISDSGLQLLETDYTVDIEYFANSLPNGGKINRIGNINVEYIATGFPNGGQISRIGNIGIERIATGFPNGGKISRIGSVDIEYNATGFPNGGKVSRISDVNFNYDNSGILNKISANQTTSGVSINIIQA